MCRRDGGGIDNENNASDPTASSAHLTLDRSKVTQNTAARNGGGITNVTGALVTLKSSYVTKNKPNNCFPWGTIAGCEN